MSGIGGINPNLPQQAQQLDQSQQVQNQGAPGAGMVGQAGQVPGASSDPSYGAVISSLTQMMPQMSGEMLDVMLLEITTKMKELEENSQKDKVKVDQEAKRSALAEKHDKLKEAETKIKEAIEKERNASIWDKIKMAFQAIGAALAMLVGAILIATGAGTAAGIALMAVGAVGLIMVADQITRMETGMGIAGNIAKAAGASPEEIAKADMGFGITMAALGIIGSVVAFFIPGNQVNAIATMAQSIATITTGVLGVATAAGDITTGVIRYDAAKMQAEGQRLQGEGKETEAWLKQLDDFIDQALQRLIGASDRFAAMLDGLMESINDTARTVAKAKFTG